MLEEKLYRDRAIELHVVGLVNLTHSSFAEKPIDSVGADLRGFGQRGTSGATGAWVGRLREHAERHIMQEPPAVRPDDVTHPARASNPDVTFNITVHRGLVGSVIWSEPNLDVTRNHRTRRNTVMLFGHTHGRLLCIDT